MIEARFNVEELRRGGDQFLTEAGATASLIVAMTDQTLAEASLFFRNQNYRPVPGFSANELRDGDFFGSS